MERGAFADRIVTAFETMPGQLRTAARYALIRLQELASSSQAARPPARAWTERRFAPRLGHEGYESISGLYAEAIRNEDLGFAGKPGLQVAGQKLKDAPALVAEMVLSLPRTETQLAASRMPWSQGSRAVRCRRLS
jgi:hypothetical protein